ncbi:hypothetical protein KO317_03710 [Candidatus Micrarchaeota archaeon]|jgi:hypothetical protein|nr:hypothetical protein [Candidatus Micrarchaeota archaeon]
MINLNHEKKLNISEIPFIGRATIFIDSLFQGNISFSEHRFEVAKRKSALLKHKSAARICLKRAERLSMDPTTIERKLLAKKMLLFAEQCYIKIDFKEKSKNIKKFNMLMNNLKDIPLSDEDLKEVRTTALKSIYEFQMW